MLSELLVAIAVTFLGILLFFFARYMRKRL
jgi:hypothetical protein